MLDDNNLGIDETMSDEMAFAPENNEEDKDKFKFDDVKDESATDLKAGLDEELANDSSDTDSASEENKEPVVSDSDKASEDDSADDSEEEEEEEEQRVPYSRFKTVKSDLDTANSNIAIMEERLSELETSRVESKPLEDIEVPPEWVELYGDTDVSKRAYKIQLQREDAIQANAVKETLKQLKTQAKEAEEQEQVNETVVEDNFSSLNESVGKKLTTKTQEAVLQIVDEFSPVDDDGKYVSLFPFDKAYEILQLRESKSKNKTTKARQKVADLTSDTSEGEVDSSEAPFKRGWDNWRDEL